MKINSINIQNYRNIENMSLEFDDVNIIYGENAQGKTNLLEAIYLFCGAKSFRTSKDSELVRFGSEFASLEISFTNESREQNAKIVINKRRKASLNGIEKKSAFELSDEIKAVVFSPVHLSMIKDGPEMRRKFVDNALCQLKPKYKILYKEYYKTLKQRNSLLKEISAGKKYNAYIDMLSVWNEGLAKYGAKIIYQRQKYIEALTPVLCEIYEGLSSGREKISLCLSCGFDAQNLSCTEIEERLLNLINEKQKNDIITSQSSVGPHRDDINILINGNNSRSFASQGQQRSCVIALKLAEASLIDKICNSKSIILLDDVLSELDEMRQDYILNKIDDRQLFITCCDAASVLRLKNGKTFCIKKGALS